MKPNHYIAYWKWADYLGRDKQNAYHSKSRVIERMERGEVLWLFTRNPNSQTIHMVQRIVVKEKGRTASMTPRIYWVQGQGELRNAEKSGQHDNWLETIGAAFTENAKSLRAESAGELAKKFMQPRHISTQSVGLLERQWKMSIPRKP